MQAWGGALTFGALCTLVGIGCGGDDDGIGPRCERDDPECLALPYNTDPGIVRPPAPPPGQRRFIDPPRANAKACSYDGECILNGCGNECDHWTDVVAAGKCPLILKLQGSYCGCVESQCAWFVGF